MLEVQGVTAGYGRVPVLWDVHLRVEEGEVVALVGANGAGKTTLLRVISCLLPLRAGEVRFAGANLRGRTPAEVTRLGLVHVPQERLLFPSLSVAEHLEIGASCHPRARERFRENREWVLELFPALVGRLRQAAGSLSGGEQQMLALARGLMACPRLLMVDEPSLGLSPLLVRTLFGAVRAISRRGVSVLLVEQNVRLSLRVAGRGYVLENGRVVLEGESRYLLQDDHVRRAYLGV